MATKKKAKKTTKTSKRTKAEPRKIVLQRTRYAVVPNGSFGGWAIVISTHRVTSFDTKSRAIEEAKLLAKNDYIQGETSQVVVHGKDGKIQFEWTYGKDPHPPKG